METESPIKITNLYIYNAMLQHFADDRVAFNSIDERFKKSDSIAISNGRHMSDIRKDLTNTSIGIQKLTESLLKHIEAVEPILNNYNDEQATKRTIGRLTTPLVTFTLTLASVIGAYYVIVGLFIKQ